MVFVTGFYSLSQQKEFNYGRMKLKIMGTIRDYGIRNLLQLMLTVVILLEKLVRPVGILQLIKTVKPETNSTKTTLWLKQTLE